MKRFDALRSSSSRNQCREFSRAHPFPARFDHAAAMNDELHHRWCVAF